MQQTILLTFPLDYHLLIQTYSTFYSIFQDNSSCDIPHRRMLRRETAVELPITPSKVAVAAPATISIEGESVVNVNELARTDRGSPNFNRNMSADPTYPRQATPQNCLMPSMSEPSNHPRSFKKSIESLQKHSSSDTEYSLQPYKVIKQSSNETSTSLTGSFNVDQSSFGGHDTSLDTNDTSALNNTVIENVAYKASVSTDSTAEPPTNSCKSSEDDTFSSSKMMPRQISLDGGMRSLKKQFSIDHSGKSFGRLTEHIEGHDIADKCSVKPPTISTIPATPTAKLSIAIGSSSSTDESKDERNIPTISTNIVQDEIAKLSSNINSSGDDDPNKNPPINETMC